MYVLTQVCTSPLYLMFAAIHLHVYIYIYICDVPHPTVYDYFVYGCMCICVRTLMNSSVSPTAGT